ncbi:MAG: T9SS type A sorting domain-containing protein [Chitinophagales bacterium]
MKKIYIAISFLLLITSVNAQIPYRHLFGSSFNGAELQQYKASRLPVLGSSTRDIYQFYIDYSASSYDDLFYVWPFNTEYNSNDAFPLNYSAVVMNYLTGYTDPADPINSFIDWSVLGLSDSFPSNVSITIDSVYNLVTHMNLTGHLDTFVLKIVKTLTNGAPSTASASILWSQRDSADFGLSPDNTWLGQIVLLAGGPEYHLDTGQMIAAVVEYYNKDKTDTFGIISGCINDGSGGAADFSTFHNSYMRLPPNIPNITKNANIGYDTDYDGIVDKAFEAQNWNWIFLITLNTVVGIADNFDNLKVTCVTPNPASGVTNILYGLKEASSVTINLFDLQGRMVRQLYNGNDGAGSFVRNINLGNINSGTYFVSVKAGNGAPAISKLIVSK